MPINVNKQIAYWRKGAKTDLQTAKILHEKRRQKEALFFAHLALEKALKALVVKATGNFPPWIHDLRRLSLQTGLEYDIQTMQFFAFMNPFSAQGRYPEPDKKPPSKANVRKILLQTERVVKWLIKQ